MWLLPKLTVDEILLYSRKSRTDDPTIPVEETLAKHEEMLDEWVARNISADERIPERNRYREVVSGETLDSRPEVLEVLRRTESQKVKALLIVEPQRLSRGDLEDIGRLVKLLRYSNTIVITLQYTYDLRDERDRDAFERELKRGNEFLEYQKRIMNNGRLASVKSGNYIGRTAPYGFRKVQIRDGRKKCFTLEPDPDTAPVVKMIYELYRDGMGMTRIADRLDELGIPAPEGGRWNRCVLPRLLKNEHYIGKVVWDRRPTTRKVVDGEIVISRPTAEDYLVYDGKHDPLIPTELWDAVQERRGQAPPLKKTNRLANPLAGLLVCKKCDKHMAWRIYKDKDGRTKAEPRFACSYQKHCKTGSAVASEVLGEVVKVLREAVADFEVRVKSGKDDSVEIHRQMVARLEKRLAELRELEVKQWDEKIKGKIPEAVFDRLNGETREEIEEVTQALCVAQDATPEPINLEERVVTFRAALDALENPDAPIEEKNALLKECIERIEYSRERPSATGHAKKGQQTPIYMDFKLRI